jgi:hypothetical protein
MLQGFLQSCLMSAFRKCYGRYNDLIDNYKLSLSHMLSDIFHTNSWPYLAHWLWQRINPHETGITGVTCRQGMLTPPRHLILHLVCRGIRVSPFISLTCNYTYVSRLITLWYLSHWKKNLYVQRKTLLKSIEREKKNLLLKSRDKHDSTFWPCKTFVTPLLTPPCSVTYQRQWIMTSVVTSFFTCHVTWRIFAAERPVA